jgi:2-polyprenyl-3-methyl-5-hydroxy-6-metoxy-1,4-benzoquinol methylase
VIQAKKILEVGCASGLHSMILSNSFLQTGAEFFVSDFCEKMVKLVFNRFKGSSIHSLLESDEILSQ